ncbi:MAG: hypothetical protein K2N05_02010 [Muribaculaceae bacterium]|nr:hypothetical protein [Muribaculaceae bacterium]
MNLRNFFFLTSIYILLSVLCSCSVSSDSETEKKLIGTWEAEETASEIEDGVEAKIQTRYSLSLSADNTFEVRMEMEYTEPFRLYLATVTVPGEWKASKKEFYLNYDIDKMNLSFGDDLEDADKKEIERDLRNEYKDGAEDIWEIIELEKDKFTIFDDEEKDRISYHRVESKSKLKAALGAAKGKSEYEADTQNPKAIRKLSLKAYNGQATPLSPQGNNTYNASNLVDGNLSTAWAVDMDKNGYDYIWGPILELNEGERVDHIKIYNGYGKNDKRYRQNSRPAWITIYRPIAPDSGDPEEENILYSGPLSDTNSGQTLKVNPRFDWSVPLNGFVLKFDNERGHGYYYGDKWPKDLLVSEIEFWGY